MFKHNQDAKTLEKGADYGVDYHRAISVILRSFLRIKRSQILEKSKEVEYTSPHA